MEVSAGADANAVHRRLTLAPADDKALGRATEAAPDHVHALLMSAIPLVNGTVDNVVEHDLVWRLVDENVPRVIRGESDARKRRRVVQAALLPPLGDVEDDEAPLEHFKHAFAGCGCRWAVERAVERGDARDMRRLADTHQTGPVGRGSNVHYPVGRSRKGVADVAFQIL